MALRCIPVMFRAFQTLRGHTAGTGQGGALLGCIVGLTWEAGGQGGGPLASMLCRDFLEHVGTWASWGAVRSLWAASPHANSRVALVLL